MKSLHLTDADFRPLADFSLAWRWTRESHALLSEAELRELSPLSSDAAHRIAEIARMLHRVDGIDRSHAAEVRVCETEAASDEDVAAWLCNLPVNPSSLVIASWDRHTALRLPWGLFARRWSDFCYPSSDDVTLLPPDGSWVCAYHHFGLLEWARAA